MFGNSVYQRDYFVTDWCVCVFRKCQHSSLLDSFNPHTLKQVTCCVHCLKHGMGGALYIWTNGMARRSAKNKHRPHSVVNQFKCSLYNHTATTLQRAGRLYCCGKKASEPFLLLIYDPLRLFLNLYLYNFYALPHLKPLNISPIFSLHYAIHHSYHIGWYPMKEAG